MLAKAMGFAAAEEAFVAGLLHDIGLVFLIHHFPDDYKAVIKSAGKHQSAIDAEKAVLGISHAEIGKMLAEKWNFPPNLCDAIGYHHQVPDRIDKVELMHLVQLGRLINKPLLEERPGNFERRLAALSRLAEMMHVDRKVIDDISYSLLTETMAAAEYLGIDIGDPADVLARANRELFKSYLTIENLFRERQELSQRILKEERRAAMMETKTVAIATMSHYINNAAMAISGRGQLIRMLTDKGSIIDQENRLAPIADVIEKSVKKILAVLAELRDLTDLEEVQKYTDSQAINIDDRLKERLNRTEENPQDVIMERPALK
jgi:signal transduction histidine kinase